LEYTASTRSAPFAWRDPELIPSLLAPHWPGTKARRLARSLFERLLPAATGFGDSLRSDM